MTRVVLLGSPPGPTDSSPPVPVPPPRAGAPDTTADDKYGKLDGLPGAPTAYGRLLGQAATLDPRPVTLARPADAAAYREHPAPVTGSVVECADLAADLRALAEIAESATENLLILPADALVHDELIYQLKSTKRGALALVIRDETADTDPDEGGTPEIGMDVLEGQPLRASVRAGRVISAGSAYHLVTHPNAVFLGPLHLNQRLLATVAETARELADMAHLFGPEDEVTSLLVLGLVRHGVSVGTRGRADLFFERRPTGESVRRMAAMNEDRARLDNAVKGADGFFTTYFVSTYSRFIARWAARRGLTPNQVTLISIFLGLCAAGAFATGDRVGYVAGGVLIYFAFVFDCVDGQLARYARKFGVLGAWLDATFDRFKEYAVYVGLAVGAAVSGQFGDGQGVWDLALTAIALQTVKHLLDFSFGAANRRKPPVPLPTLPLSHADDAPLMEALAQRKDANNRGIRGLIRFWSRAGRFKTVYWARKMIVFPIGERFAAIAIVTALFDPRITFVTLITWGAIATAYTVTGRILRSAA